MIGKTVYVRDNGMAYSDRRIEFIEDADNLDQDMIIRFLEADTTERTGAPRVIAVGEMKFLHPVPIKLHAWLYGRIIELEFYDDTKQIVDEITAYLVEHDCHI